MNTDEKLLREELERIVLERFGEPLLEDVDPVVDDADYPLPMHLDGRTKEQDLGPVAPTKPDHAIVALDPYARDVR